MSNFFSKDIEYQLLQMIAEHQAPIGAGILADLLQERDISAISEATIGRYLRKFEKQGFLKSEKYNGRSRGRVITDEGQARIRELSAQKRQTKAVLDTIEIFRNGYGEHLRNILLAREIIEPEVAALAAQNATPENLEDLQKIVEESARLTGQGESMASTDAPFHIAIAKASGNPVLEAVMKMLRADRDYSPELERIINTTSLNNPSDHMSIYQAIRNRNPEQARRIMKQHIYNLIQKMNAYEKEQDSHSAT